MRRSLARLAQVALVACAAACAPDRGDAYVRSFAAAERAYHAGRFDEAAARFDEAAAGAKIPRDAVFARYEAALARARAGDVARAARELNAIANAKPPNEYSAQAAYKSADLTRASDEARGVREMERVALRFPESGVARVALLHVIRHDDEAGGPSRALAHLDALSPRLRGTALEETVAYERAKRLAALGRAQAARDAFLDVAARWPYPFGAYFDDALYRASEMDEKLGRTAEAIADLERLLSHRESASFMGTYERPRYEPAILRIAALYEKQGRLDAARAALHRLYSDFPTSTKRDDALYREARLFRRDGDDDAACDRLDTLVSDFPDSRYVPCAVERCPGLRRPERSEAPKTCHAYIERADGQRR